MKKKSCLFEAIFQERGDKIALVAHNWPMKGYKYVTTVYQTNQGSQICDVSSFAIQRLRTCEVSSSAVVGLPSLITYKLNVSCNRAVS